MNIDIFIIIVSSKSFWELKCFSKNFSLIKVLFQWKQKQLAQKPEGENSVSSSNGLKNKYSGHDFLTVT